MKFKTIFIVCFLFMFFALTVSAEYYLYIDTNGVKHYTDDISEIPENQRPKLNVYQSIQTSPEKKPREEEQIETKSTISLESLGTQRDELVNEYNALIKRNEALAKQKKTLNEKEYNKLATQLNIEIKQYQDKQQPYEKLVEQYNEQIKPSDKN